MTPSSTVAASDADSHYKPRHDRHDTRRALREQEAPPKVPIGLRLTSFFGELLITLGVLLGLFVVWQLWWTDVEGERSAANAVEQFEATLPESPEVAGAPQTTDPPAPAVIPSNAEVFGTLYVPDWGADYQMPIASGVGRADVLDAGRVGHYPETALPGQVGNFSLAGHRQTYGRPFHDIDTLEPGDPIIVRTADAWFVYHVTEYQIIQPTQVEVIAPVPGDPTAVATERMITLTTCHPLWSTRQRYVVHGVLDHWIALEDGRPAELIEGDS